MVSRKCARRGCNSSLGNTKGKYCVPCRTENKRRAHDRRVESQYGLDPGDYEKMYEAQGGTCAIHGCRARGLKVSLAVDHDHTCTAGHPKDHGCKKCVRGLVCKRHNREIGYNGDDPLAFLSLYNYLVDPPARKVFHATSLPQGWPGQWQGH